MERLIDRGHAYAGRRRRLLRRALVPGVRRAVPPAGRRRGAGRGRGQRQARPAGLHPVEGGQAGRAVLADAVGPRPARLAPGVLGDGHHLPRPGVRHPRRRPRPGLPAPRERAGAVARGRRRVRPVLAAQRLGHHGRREDVQVAGQHADHRRAAAAGCAGSSCATTWSARTTGRRSSTPTPRCRSRWPRTGGSSRSCTGSGSGSAPRRSACSARSSPPRWTTTSARPGALAAIHGAVREGNTALDAGDRAGAPARPRRRCGR